MHSVRPRIPFRQCSGLAIAIGLTGAAVVLAGCRSLQVNHPIATALSDGWVVSAGPTGSSRSLPEPKTTTAPSRRWTRKVPAGPGPAPALALDGVVYVSTLKGELVAFRLRDGRGLGKRRFGRAMVGAPAMDSRTVYVSSAWGKKVLAAHDLRRGRSRWEKSGAPLEAGLVLTDSLVVAADVEGSIWGLYRSSGAVRWHVPGDPRHGVFSSPVLAGDLLVVADDRGLVRALDARSGRSVWHRALELPVLVDPASNGRSVFLSSTRGAVVSLRVSDGSVLWRFDSDDRLVRFTAAAVLDSTVVFAGSDGTVRALDAETGEARWTYRVPAAVTAPPLVVGETVCVAAYDRTVYGFRLSDGEPEWSFPVEGAVKSAMAFYRGHLIVLSEPRHVHVFRMADARTEADS